MLLKTVACVLSALLICPAAMPVEPQTPTPLKIVALQGEGAVNNFKTKTVTEPIVEVRDDRDLPMAGADVVFTLPPSGPGGVFPGGGRIFTTKSNAQGQAAAVTFAPNNEVGRFNIKVTVTREGQTANLIISQRNSLDLAAEPKRGGHKKWIIITIIGAAVATGGIIWATRGGNDTPPNAISISPGTVTIGGPR